MRVILDTNVLLAALISTYSTPSIIYQTWRAGGFDLVTATEQLNELRRVSRYAKIKAILPAHRIGTMINNLRRAILFDALPPLPDSIKVNDPNDAFLLSLALLGEADYLVTGDHRAGLLQRGSMGRTRIVTPVVFCAEAL
jgi:putative PIN family toxin of toxin-antitoxin system